VDFARRFCTDTGEITDWTTLAPEIVARRDTTESTPDSRSNPAKDEI